MVVLLFLLMLVAAGGPATAWPLPAEEASGPVIVLFHGEGCPHCAAEREFLADLQGRHPEVVVEMHEVWYDAANRDLLRRTSERLGFEATGVPVTVIGDQVWIGFGATTAAEIESVVTSSDAGAAAASGSADGDRQTALVDVPIVGPVDLSSSSLLVSTLVIGFVDGVNPCSLWVLSLLLAIVLNHGSRRRVVLVGGVFLAVTAAMYAIYVGGLYSALDVVGGLSWIRWVVALVALAFGVLQLKDGIRPGVGPSLSIAPSQRPGIYQRIRHVADPGQGVAATLAGTVVLAVGVSLLETPCTAGLPLLWTSLLSAQDVSLTTAAALFAVYMTVFLLDELIVFTVAVLTLRAAKLQERHGRLLKLLSGSVLVCLAVAMIAVPEALDTVLGTVVVFGIAGVLTAILWAATMPTTARHPAA